MLLASDINFHQNSDSIISFIGDHRPPIFHPNIFFFCINKEYNIFTKKGSAKCGIHLRWTGGLCYVPQNLVRSYSHARSHKCSPQDFSLVYKQVNCVNLHELKKKEVFCSFYHSRHFCRISLPDFYNTSTSIFMCFMPFKLFHDMSSYKCFWVNI